MIFMTRKADADERHKSAAQDRFWIYLAQLTFAMLSMSSLTSQLHAAKRWIHLDATGKLMYGHTPNGDRIADFSSAGYHGGGIALPEVPERLLVKPSGADDTAAIQQALDKLGNMPLVNGSHGAVALAAGTFKIGGTLRFASAGVVLRGAGMQEQGTTLLLTGNPHLALSVSGNLKETRVGIPTTMIDDYVASGRRGHRCYYQAGHRSMADPNGDGQLGTPKRQERTLDSRRFDRSSPYRRNLWKPC